ncbi:MAG: hypothetical protein ACI841_003208 [Planctomycetota bacterium]|jgi:hypothetical protein
MLSKDHVLESILHECDVCLHLHSNLPEGGLDYRQSETQRTTLEVLRYVSFCGIGGTRAMIDGNWDAYQELAKASEELAIADFPSAMERQKEALSKAFAELGDEDLQREVKLPTGKTVSLAQALVEVPLKWMTAYRMQIFLGAKAAGNIELRTPDCWAGVSMPREASPA